MYNLKEYLEKSLRLEMFNHYSPITNVTERIFSILKENCEYFLTNDEHVTG